MRAGARSVVPAARLITHPSSPATPSSQRTSHESPRAGINITMASRLVISLLFATSVALDELNLRDARAAADLERRSGGQDLSARAADLERRSGGRDMKMGYQPETDAPTTAPTAAPTGPCGMGVEESPKDSIFNSTSLACECPEDKEYKRMEPPGSPQAGMWICSATQCHPAATLIQTPGWPDHGHQRHPRDAGPDRQVREAHHGRRKRDARS